MLVAVLVVPTWMLTDSLMASAQVPGRSGGDRRSAYPAAAGKRCRLARYRRKSYAAWQRAAANLPAFLQDYTEQIKALGAWLLATVTGTGLTILQFIISFVIAGVFLATADKSVAAAEALAARLAGDRGSDFANLASGTIRNVALGIVGVSIVQTALLSLGFLVIGLPGAGFWALIVLIL